MKLTDLLPILLGGAAGAASPAAGRGILTANRLLSDREYQKQAQQRRAEEEEERQNAKETEKAKRDLYQQAARQMLSGNRERGLRLLAAVDPAAAIRLGDSDRASAERAESDGWERFQGRMKEKQAAGDQRTREGAASILQTGDRRGAAELLRGTDPGASMSLLQPEGSTSPYAKLGEGWLYNRDTGERIKPPGEYGKYVENRAKALKLLKTEIRLDKAVQTIRDRIETLETERAQTAKMIAAMQSNPQAASRPGAPDMGELQNKLLNIVQRKRLAEKELSVAQLEFQDFLDTNETVDDTLHEGEKGRKKAQMTSDGQTVPSHREKPGAAGGGADFVYDPKTRTVIRAGG